MASDAADGHDSSRATGLRVGEEPLELSHLVAAVRSVRQVVAFDPQLTASRWPFRPIRPLGVR